jgi:uncharacterized protein (UPF0332 family)
MAQVRDANLKDKLDFRLRFSEDKLALAKILLQNNKANDAVLYAYLTIFYAMRAFLVHGEHDSDNFEEILSLYEKYYKEKAPFSLDISPILERSLNFKQQMSQDDSAVIPLEEARQCIDYAGQVLQEVKNYINKG